MFRLFHSNRSNGYYTLQYKELYDFLFDEGHSAWFCNAARATYASVGTREFKDFMMRLHTGESLVAGTPNWSWPQRETLGQRYLKDLAEDILAHWDDRSPESTYLRDKLIELKRSMELDGFKYISGSLIPSEAEVLDTSEETGAVQRLFRELGLGDETTAFHHLDLTETHYLAGHWDDSISNSRKFLECVLQQVAAKQSLGGTEPIDADALTRPARVRDYLQRVGLLEEKEKAAVASVYGLLSETGSHPYVAQQEQARLMRHLALTFSQFVMLRLQGSRAAP